MVTGPFTAVDYRPELLVLDATADPDLLKQVFERPINYPPASPEWPANVHVYQWTNGTVGRGTLSLYPQGKPRSPV